MAERNFMDLLKARWHEGKFVCAGLDPQFLEPADFPEGVRGDSIDELLVNFLCPIVEAISGQVAWIKPNPSFFIKHGWRGVKALEELYAFMQAVAPGCLRIHDAKNGDIGDTNLGYARFAFEILGADAITLHNYMGCRAMEPFLERGDKGCFILVRTSNPGAEEFQGQEVKSEGQNPTEVLYKRVARHVRDPDLWNGNGNCGAVVGASETAMKDIAGARELLGDEIAFLLPGVGKQGGSAAEAYRLGCNSSGTGIGINQSSGFTHAHRKPQHEGVHWAEAAAAEVMLMNDEITAARAAA